MGLKLFKSIIAGFYELLRENRTILIAETFGEAHSNPVNCRQGTVCSIFRLSIKKQMFCKNNLPKIRSMKYRVSKKGLKL